MSPPTRGGGAFEHCDATRAMPRVFQKAGYSSLGGSEIDPHALQYQRGIFGDENTHSADLFSDPIRSLTQTQKRMLEVMIGRYPYNPFCTVNRFRKDHEDPAAWLAYEALKILGDPDVNLDMVVAENVTSWTNDPKVPDARRKLATRRGYSMQIMRIFTFHCGKPNVRRRILVFWGLKDWTLDLLGEIETPQPTHAPVAVAGYLIDEVPFGLWVEGKVVPYTGSRYHSSYPPSERAI